MFLVLFYFVAKSWKTAHIFIKHEEFPIKAGNSAYFENGVIYTRMNDKELIREIQGGASSAFKELVEQYQDLVVNTCYGFVHNHEDAEDIAQEVFIAVYKSVGSFREDAKLSSWLYRIAVNKSLNFIKANKRRKWISSIQTLLGSEEKPKEFADTKASNPQADLEQQERVRILHRAIDSLAENQKIAFALSKYEGLSYKDIADVMGTTVSAVESLLNRAKNNLQKKLYNYYKDG